MTPGNGANTKYDTWVYKGLLAFISILVSIICYLVWIPYNNITSTITDVCRIQKEDHARIVQIGERQDQVRELNIKQDGLLSEHGQRLFDHDKRIGILEHRDNKK